MLSLIKFYGASLGLAASVFAQAITEPSPTWLDAGIPISASAFAFFILYQMANGSVVARSTISAVAEIAAREAVDRILREHRNG